MEERWDTQDRAEHSPTGRGEHWGGVTMGYGHSPEMTLLKKHAFYREKEVRGIGNGARQSEPIVHSAHTKPTEVMKELRELR